MRSHQNMWVIVGASSLVLGGSAAMALAGLVDGGSVAAAVSVAMVDAAPKVSGQGKAGRHAARQRDYKGGKAHRASRAARRLSRHETARQGRRGVTKHITKNITKNVHKKVVKIEGGHHGFRSGFHAGVHVGLGFAGSHHYGLGRHYGYGYGGYGYSSPYRPGYRGGYDYGYGHDYSYGDYYHDGYYRKYYHEYSRRYGPFDDYGHHGYNDSSYTFRHDPYSRRRVTVYAPPPVVIVDRSREGYSDRDRPIHAWEALALGDAHTARSRFSKLAAAHPSDAAPKVGYAIAAALESDDDSAAWAFRRALTIDPLGVDQTPLPAGVVEALESLMYRYRDKAENARSRDASTQAFFLLATVSHLLGDHDAAQEALHALRAAGEDGLAVRNLASLVDRAAREAHEPYDDH